MNDHELLEQLALIIIELDQVIYQVKNQFPENPYRIMDINGRFLLGDILAAKAQALAAIAQLKSFS